MNTELQQAVTQLVNKALSGADAGVDFLNQQLPDYILQLLLWHGVHYFILFLIGTIGVIAAVTADIRVFEYYKEKDSDEFVVMYFVFGSVIRILVWAVLIDMCLNLTWLQVWLAPKVWLVEYAANLVK